MNAPATIKIVSRWDSTKVLWEGEAGSIAEAIKKARARGAHLGDADLGGADLRDAHLGGADLRGADLRGADAEELKKRGAVFDGPARHGPKEDLWSVLDQAPAEVPALLDALRNGKINGTVYQGDCACLVGTIANARGCDYESLPGLTPDPSCPAERWFYSIRPGRTPDRSSKVRRTVEWVQEWQAKHAEAAPPVQS